jgi:hypothetical protein
MELIVIKPDGLWLFPEKIHPKPQQEKCPLLETIKIRRLRPANSRYGTQITRQEPGAG